MRPISRRSAAALARTASLAFFIVFIAGAVNGQSLGLKGRSAPELEVDSWLRLPEGESQLSLAALRGRIVYLYFFQSWCPGCHSHGFPTLSSVHSAFQDDSRVVFVAIQTTFEGYGTNTADRALETVDSYGLPIPVGHDSNEEGDGPSLMERYRSGGTPWTVLIDATGKVRFNDFQIESEEAIEVIQILLAQSPPRADGP